MPNVIAGGCGIMLLLLVLNTPGEVESGDGGAEVSSKNCDSMRNIRTAIRRQYNKEIENFDVKLNCDIC